MTALLKIGLLFAGGLAVGAMVPLGPDRPAKRSLPRPDEPMSVPHVGTALTVRCIVEPQQDAQVEVVVRPATEEEPATTKDVVVVFRVGKRDVSQDNGEPPLPRRGVAFKRSMPRAD